MIYEIRHTRQDSFKPQNLTMLDSNFNVMMKDRFGGSKRVSYSSSESRYRITGRIRDRDNRTVEGYTVQAFDEDLGGRLNPDDLLGDVKADKNGTFEMTFSKDAFEDWFDLDPDVYLVVKDRSSRVTIRTTGKKNTTKLMDFQIKLDGGEIRPTGGDPYKDGLLLMIRALRDAGDAADPFKGDAKVIFELLMRVVAGWTVNRDELVKLRGYDSIQVPKNPRGQKHHHVIRWDKPIYRI